MQHGGAANANDTRGETGRKKNTQENNIKRLKLCVHGKGMLQSTTTHAPNRA